MGRVKIPLKKIENKTYKHITFSKRKNGIVKKAYELSVLCDVEIALVIFSPAGKLIIYDGKKRLEDIFQSFLDLPEHKRDSIPNQELVRRIVTELRLESLIYHQFNSGNSNEGVVLNLESQLDVNIKEMEEEIARCRFQLEDVEKQLEYFVKSPNFIKSVLEADHHENVLQETLAHVRAQKQYLEATDNIGNLNDLNGTFDWSSTPVTNPTNPEIAFHNFSEIFQTPSEHVTPQTDNGDAGGQL